MKHFLILCTAAVAIVTAWEAVTTYRLRQELETARTRIARLPAVQRHHAELAVRAASDAELAAARKAAAERRTDAPVAAAVHPPPNALDLSEWRPASAWTNRGQASPVDALETALFAAAGGDVARFSSLVELHADVRARTDGLLQTLPAEARALYPTPESLVSALAIKHIPIGEAQLVWAQPLGNDDAVACVFLRNPPAEIDRAEFTAPISPSGPPALEAPHLTRDALIKPVVLSFHRQATQWKLVVPPEAIDRYAAELKRPNPPGS